jgi:serine/threonine protein kinase/Tol biopolymer transport system component
MGYTPGLMPLSAGSRLGPYEILTPLGAGGMGEVYRAKDTRLGRTVAIKILPPHLSHDAILRQRFEREAKAISSLNHPHICVLHDVGQQDGTDFLVMEYLEGETLAQRLTKGALPVEHALKIGIEIADALDRAHRHGVVHRDLKPGNIMLTTSGAKLLDFGLAKAAPSLGAGATLTAAAAPTTPVTQQGTIVGTFQYMSPEQVEGKEVDARSDIFSFGSVLYEMMTGRRAFRGQSPLSVASAVLEKDPESISTLQPMTPPALDRTIRVCLAKDRENRWQTARDLLRELRWIAEAGSQAGVPSPVISHRKARERLAWITAAVLAIAAVIAGVGWWRAAGISPPRPSMRLSMELSPGEIIDRFRGAQPALSPDGTRIVVIEMDSSGKYRLAMRSLDQSQFTPVPGTDGAGTPFFSPDGQWLAFFVDDKLKKIPVQGGAPVTLCDAPGYPGGASWGDDGNIVAALNMMGSSGLVRVSSGGGAPLPVTRLSTEKSEIAHIWPQVLPGSQAVLFTAYKNGYLANGDGEIEVVSLKTGERKTLQRAGSFGRYLPSGHLIYLQENTLWAAPFDLGKLVVTGAPQPVLEEVNGDPYIGGDFDCSQTGTFVYVSSRVESSFPYSIWWLDSTGQTNPLQVTPGLYENLHFSPDGKRLAFEMAIGSGRSDIWLKDLDRDTVSRLTHLPGRNNWPVWNPDGQSLVFTSLAHPAEGLYWVRADGSGDAQRLMDNKTDIPVANSFTPDGKRIAYSHGPDNFHSEIWTAPVEGDRENPRLGKEERFSTGSFSEWMPVFSPDGTWLAYSSSESGTAELYVRRYPGPGGKSQISTGGGSHPIWSRQEHKLFYPTPDWRIMEVGYSATGDSFAAEKPWMWSQKGLAFLGGCYPYDLAPDGKRFAVVLNPGAAGEPGRKPTDSVVVLLNFFDELRRKLPRGKK